MSKLVITSSSNGTIRYIEGDEIEISVEGVKDRISAIEKKLVEKDTEFNSRIQQIKTSEEERIQRRKYQLEADIQAANQRYNSEVEAIKKEVENKINQETLEYNKGKEERESLEKEKIKLMAVLKSAPVQQSTTPSPIPAVEQVISKPEVKPVQNKSGRIIF